MRLVDLNPEWVGSGGPGVTNSSDGSPVPRRERVAIDMDCPCGSSSCERLLIAFLNPEDGQPSIYHPRGWHREGDTFETLTLSPSIQRIVLKRQDGTPVNCAWHGFIQNGEIVNA